MEKSYYKFHVTRVTEYTGSLPTSDTIKAKILLRESDIDVVGYTLDKTTIPHLAFDGVVTLFDIKMTKAMYRYLDQERAAAERQVVLGHADSVPRGRRKKPPATYEETSWHLFKVTVITEYVAWAEAPDEATAREMVTDENARDVFYAQKYRDVFSVKLLGNASSMGLAAPSEGSPSPTQQNRKASKRRATVDGKVPNPGVRRKRATQNKPDEELPKPAPSRSLDQVIEQNVTVIDNIIALLAQRTDKTGEDYQAVHRLAIQATRSLDDRLDGLRRRLLSPNGNLLNHAALHHSIRQTRARLETLHKLSP